MYRIKYRIISHSVERLTADLGQEVVGLISGAKQGLKITEKWRYCPCHAKGWTFEWLGWPHKMAILSPAGHCKNSLLNYYFHAKHINDQALLGYNSKKQLGLETVTYMKDSRNGHKWHKDGWQLKKAQLQ